MAGSEKIMAGLPLLWAGLGMNGRSLSGSIQWWRPKVSVDALARDVAQVRCSLPRRGPARSERPRIRVSMFRFRPWSPLPTR
jgi:hypothetical protein